MWTKYEPNGWLWRKSVGVEPTRDVVRPSPDLKSERPTGVRSSSSEVPLILNGKNRRG
jgi:hypothetical protein